MSDVWDGLGMEWNGENGDDGVYIYMACFHYTLGWAARFLSFFFFFFFFLGFKLP